MPLSAPADPSSASLAITHLKATYTNANSSSGSTSESPNGSSLSHATPFAISTPLPLPISDSAEHRKAYLSTLREAVTALQERINSELTARMEVEAREAANTFATANGGKAGIDETAEEENYGEEVMEEEE